jgi:hypothetical protein
MVMGEGAPGTKFRGGGGMSMTFSIGGKFHWGICWREHFGGGGVCL